MLELVTLCLSANAPIYLGYQDSLGQYTFGYSSPESARSEIRSIDGLTTGSYSYIDGAGIIQSARYEADSKGFRIAATNLPQAPQPVVDTPEVQAARNEHLKLLALAEQLAQEKEQKINEPKVAQFQLKSLPNNQEQSEFLLEKETEDKNEQEPVDKKPESEKVITVQKKLLLHVYNLETEVTDNNLLL